MRHRRLSHAVPASAGRLGLILLLGAGTAGWSGLAHSAAPGSPGAQGGSFVGMAAWEQTLSAGSFGGLARAVAFAPNGDVIVAGRVGEFGYDSMFKVARYTPHGDLVWAHEVVDDLDLTGEAVGVHVEPDTGFILAGGTLRLASVPFMVLVGLQPDGAETQRLMVSPPGVAATAMSADAQGVVLAGYSVSQQLGTGSSFQWAATRVEQRDMIRWHVKIPGNGSPHDVVSDAGLGQAALVGSDNSLFTVRKLDLSNGAPLWTYQAPSLGYFSYAAGVAMNAIGDVAAAGTDYDGFGSLFTVARLRSMDGSEQWREQVVGDLYSYGGAYDVLFNAADDVIAAGEYAPILVRPGRGRRQGFSSVVHFATFAFAGADGSELWRNVVVREVDLKFFRTGIAQSLERVGASGSELILVGGSLVRDAGSTGTLGNGALPDFDAFVVAYDASGAEVARWSGAHAGTADGVNDELLDLAVQGPGVTNIAFGGTLEDDLGAPAFGAGYIDRQPPDVMVHLSTNQLPADGGRLNVMLEVRDNVDDEDLSASATLVGPNGSVDIPLTRVPGPAAGPATHTTALFVGSTVVPRNDLECAIGFSAVGTGTDRSGNVGMASNSLSQDGQPDVTPPMLSDCLASPPTLPPSGGGVSLGVTATDACGVQSAIAILTRPGGSQQIVPLFHGSQNRWTGTVPIPPNQTPVAERYGVRFEARDPTGNVGMLPCNDIEVLPSATGDIEPPEISDCVVGTTLLPRKGGPVSIAATVTDNVAVASVEAVIGSTDPPGEQRITLNRLTPQGDVYQGVADIGPNPTGARRSFMVTIEARDSSGNPATHPCTGFDQEGGEGKLRASEKRLSFGRIGIGNYEVRRITFRNVGDAPLQVSLQDPGAPFAVFETSNVFPGLNKRAGAASSGGMAFRLEPGEGKKFWLRFIPEKVKRYRGELRATGSGRPAQLTVPLLGEGCKGNR